MISSDMVCELIGRSLTFWQGRDNTDIRGADFKKKYLQSFYWQELVLAMDWNGKQGNS